MKEPSKAKRPEERLAYPRDEARFPWLSALLAAYHVIDSGTALELAEEEGRRGARVACRRGCSACCFVPTVPLSPLEVRGLCWYVTEKLAGVTRQTVRSQLRHHRDLAQCPFLAGTDCSVYTLRPHACRLLYVFGRPCGPDEEIERTRPRDIWTHSLNVARRAAFLVLPYYGIEGGREKAEAFEEGLILDISTPMHQLPWEELYDRLG